MSISFITFFITKIDGCHFFLVLSLPTLRFFCRKDKHSFQKTTPSEKNLYSLFKKHCIMSLNFSDFLEILKLYK